MFSLSFSICVDVKCLLLAGVAVSFLTQSILRQTTTKHVGVMHCGLLHGCILLKSQSCRNNFKKPQL